MQYRHDINGLRSLAILAILIFHIDPRFSGGFIGVDIFFVISGYLITGAIWRQLQSGSFSFYEFYLKRIRRLFPALFVMLVICFGLMLSFGLSTEIAQFGKGMLASLFYVSNIFFYSQVDYFAADAQLNPLLHTWSLSVEEQFYLIFPVLLLFIFKQKTRQFALLMLFFICSLLLSIALLQFDTSAAFYMAPSRFWQFLAGSFIAIYGAKLVLSQSQKELMGGLGLVMIVLALVFYHEGLPFPGMYAIPPTLGTAMIILSGGGQTILNRILSMRLPCFFGDISYSLYLWHWPVIVLYKLLVNPILQRNDKILIFAVSIFLGYMSWKFVEQPFRHVSLQKGRNKLLRYTSIASLALSLMAVLSFSSTLFLPKDKLQFEQFITYKMQARTGQCFLTSGTNDVNLFDEAECIRLKEGTNVLLVGDSHAAHYYAAMVQYFSGSNISQVTSSGCRPIITYIGKKRCTELIKRTYGVYLDKYKFDLVVLAGRWNKDDLLGLQQTLEYLRSNNIQVLLIGPVIEYVQALPVLLARFGTENTSDTNNKIEIARIYSDRFTINAALAKLAEQNQVNYLSPIEHMCPSGKCITVLENGEPIQFDNGHLTTNGALYVLGKMIDREWINWHQSASDEQ